MKYKRQVGGVKTLGYTNLREAKSNKHLLLKEKYGDGTVVEIAIWIVSVSESQPHGIKYRLHFEDFWSDVARHRRKRT